MREAAEIVGHPDNRLFFTLAITGAAPRTTPSSLLLDTLLRAHEEGEPSSATAALVSCGGGGRGAVPSWDM